MAEDILESYSEGDSAVALAAIKANRLAQDAAVAAQQSATFVTQPRPPRQMLRVPGSASGNQAPQFGTVDAADILGSPKVRPSSLRTPLILRDVIGDHYTPASFDCPCDGSDDTDNKFQTAVRECARAGVPLYIDRDQYIKVTPAHSGPLFFGDPLRPTNYAININENNVHIVGRGGKVVMGMPAAGHATGRIYMFATDNNLDPGAIRSMRFEGDFVDLDHSLNGGIGGIFALVIGVDDLSLEGFYAENSTGTIRGQVVHAINTRRVRLTDFSARNVSQALNTGYTDQIILTSIQGDRVTEFGDINFQNNDFIFQGGTFTDFTSAQQSQVFDVVANRVTVHGLHAYNIPGNVIAAYTKHSYPTYRAHYEAGGVPPTTPVPIRSISLTGIKGERLGTHENYVSIFVALERGTTSDGSVARAITLADIKLKDSSGIAVREGDSVTVRDVDLEVVRCGPQANFAAAWIGQSQGSEPGRTDSFFKGRVDGLRVSGATHHGIYLNGWQEGAARGLVCDSYGTAPVSGQGTPRGVTVQDIGIKAGMLEIGDIVSIDGAMTGGAALQLHGHANSADPVGRSVHFTGGIRLVGSNPLITGGSAPWLGTVRGWRNVVIRDLNTFNPNPTSINGGRQRIEEPFYMQPVGVASFLRFFSARLISLDGVVVPVGGVMNIVLQKVAADGVTLTTLMGWNIATDLARGALVPVGSAPAASSAGLLGPGEMLRLVCTRDASGTYGIGVNGGDFQLQWTAKDVETS